MNHTVIFTDLDGTLLDAASYSYSEALPALGLIAASGMPLILCSSKSRTELEAYRLRLHNVHPFVAENGGGIFIPQGYFQAPIAAPIEAQESNGYQLIQAGTSYAEIRRQFVRLRQQTGAKVRGFADMSVAEVAALTGLPAEEAILAKQRDFEEAFVFDGETDENFLHAIENAGLRWTQGRIFHLTGNHDKGRAVDILMSLYRRQFGMIDSIGLGDSLNDLTMLRAVDRPVLVRHADGSFDTRIDLPRMIKTQLPGPAGWNATMLHLLAQGQSANAATVQDRRQLLEIFHAALAAADPYNAVLGAVSVEHGQLRVAGAAYTLDAYNCIKVVGAGKATARMALAIESLLGDRIDAGLIIVKDGHSVPLSIIEQVESSHPVPAAAAVEGTRRVLDMLHAASDNTLVICLLSGGASALLVSPAAGIELQDKQETTRLLLNAGASIGELNAVRKHLSAVKGGRLAQVSYPAQVITLIVSDVIGDPLDVIASGPTAPDSSSFADAWAVLLKYGLQQKLPARIADYLRRGMAGRAEETVKKNNPCMEKTHNVIIAGVHQALAAAQQSCARLGLAATTISESIQGEARDAARFLAQAARAELAVMKPHERRCLLSGGETTVRVRGAGKGGRNQELALAFAIKTEGLPGISLLAAGTDGTDGPTDAAGAVVDGSTVLRARLAGIEPLGYLEDNDSYTFFQKFDAATGGQSHLKTGPTGTNVMDLQIVLLSRDGGSLGIS